MKLDFVAFFIGFILLGHVSADRERNPVSNGNEKTISLEGINADPDFPVEDLVQEVFARGACETITDVQSIGNEQGIGFFSNGLDVIGIEEGIILSTGNVTNAHGPNTASDISTDFGDGSGDPDLDSIAIEEVKDAVGISFDFIPLDSIITFRYVFASEEYCEYVGSDFNDVFGFFISGPGISGPYTDGAENVARIPGSLSLVSINTVNHNVNPLYYIGNESQADANECEVPFNASQQDFLEYDGFTKVLTATLHLTPCETYHIRMVIGDVKDNVYDSAVFLEAGSFNLGTKVEVSSNGYGADNPQIVGEGCDGYFLFEREAGAPLDNPITVAYHLSDQNTAVSGQDFTAFPLTATIPAGEASVMVSVSTLNDGDMEIGETLGIVLETPCECYSDSATLIIVEPEPVQVNLPDIMVCSGESVSHSPLVNGGFPPYTYVWNTGETEAMVDVAGGGLSQYAVTVYDHCGHWAVDTCVVQTTEPPNVEMTGEAMICEGDTAYFEVNFSGIPPFDFVYAINGESQPPIEGIMQPNILIPAFAEGTYEPVSIGDQVCNGDLFGEAELEIMEIETSFIVEDVSCNGFNDGRVAAQVFGVNPPFELSWSGGLGQAMSVDSLSPGTYELSVTDAIGCDEVNLVTITEPPVLEEITIDCEMLFGDELILSASGGTTPYLYSLDSVSFQETEFFDDLVAGETYPLIIKDFNDCVLEQDFVMPTLYNPMLFLPEEIEVLKEEQHQLMLELNFPESLLASVIWAPEAHLSCSDCLNPIHTAIDGGLYFVQVTDIFGCKDFAGIDISIKEEIDYFVPTIFSPDGDEVNDYFMPFFSENHVNQVLLFQVFNRWGGLMHEARNFTPNNERLGWDGNLGGQPVNSGVYVYLVKVRLRDGREKIFTGDIVLMR